MVDFKVLPTVNGVAVSLVTHTHSYQPLDDELTALASLVSAADKLPYFTGIGTADLTDLTAFIRTLLDDVDASTARATLELGTAALVNDNTLVHIAGNETITGVKTFSNDIVVGANIRKADGVGYIALIGGTSLTEGPYIQVVGKDTGGPDDGKVMYVSTTESSAIGNHEWWVFNGTSYTQIASLTPAGNFQIDGTLTIGSTLVSAFALTLLDDANAATARTTLGLGTIATAAATDYVDKVSNENVGGAKVFTNQSLTIGDGTTHAQLFLNGAIASARAIVGFSNNSWRWSFSLADATAESGGNAGANVSFTRFSDTGVFIDVPLTIERSTGKTTLLIADVTGLLTVGNTASTGAIVITGASGLSRQLAFRTGTSNRWIFNLATAESGSNVGSDFQLLSRTDAGAALRTDLHITRSTGFWGIGITPVAPFHLDATTTAFDATTGLAIFQDSSDRQIAIGGLGLFRRDADLDNGDLRINYIGYLGGITRFRDLVIYNGKQTAIAYFDGSSGFVGINDNAPPVRMSVSNGVFGGTPHAFTALLVEDDTSAAITIGTPSSGTGFLFFADEASGAVGQIAYVHSTDQMRLITGGANRVYIDTNGLEILPSTTGSTLKVGRLSGFSSIESTAVASFWLIMDGNVANNGNAGINYYSAGDVILANGGGDVAIGTLTPQKKVHIHTTTANRHLYMSSVAPAVMLGNNELIASATQYGLLGLATTANHFVTGTTAGDLVLNTSLAGAGTARDIWIANNGVVAIKAIASTGNVELGAGSYVFGKIASTVGNIYAAGGNVVSLTPTQIGTTQTWTVNMTIVGGTNAGGIVDVYFTIFASASASVRLLYKASIAFYRAASGATAVIYGTHEEHKDVNGITMTGPTTIANGIRFTFATPSSTANRVGGFIVGTIFPGVLSVTSAVA